MRKKLNFIIIFMMAVVVLYFSFRENYETTIDLIVNANAWFLLLAFGFFLYFLYLRSNIFYRLVRNHKPDYSKWEAFRTTLAVQFFQGITPFSSGGQPYEVYALSKQKIKTTTASNISIQHFIMYQIALVFLGMIAIVSNYFLVILKEDIFLGKLVTIGFIINLVVILVLFSVSFFKKLNTFIICKFIKLLCKIKIVKNYEETQNYIQGHINEFHEGAEKLLENKHTFFKGILINIFGLIIFYLVPLTIIFSFGVFMSINVFEAIIVTAYVMLIGSFVPLPGGSGGLEYSFIAFYAMFIPPGTAVAAMILWRLITYYLGLIFGSVATNLIKE